jgi:CDP-diacylglycerol--glycerol-3-phosphate 3-phosphatidyltransferase
VSRSQSLGRQALSLPNLVTSVRILAIPAVLGIMQYDSPENAFFASLVFAAASGTDFLDGWLARRFDQVSVVGKLLDPLADKLIVTGVLVMLVDLGRVSAWLVFVILAREMFVTGLRSIAATEGVVIAARDLGKQKTAFQMVGLWGLIVHYEYPVLWGEPASFHRIGLWCLIISVGFSLVSAADYVRGFAREVRPPGAAGEGARREASSAAAERGG